MDQELIQRLKDCLEDLELEECMNSTESLKQAIFMINAGIKEIDGSLDKDIDEEDWDDIEVAPPIRRGDVRAPPPKPAKIKAVTPAPAPQWEPPPQEEVREVPQRLKTNRKYR